MTAMGRLQAFGCAKPQSPVPGANCYPGNETKRQPDCHALPAKKRARARELTGCVIVPQAMPFYRGAFMGMAVPMI